MKGCGGSFESLVHDQRTSLPDIVLLSNAHTPCADTFQDGTGKYPDGTPIHKLEVLPDRQSPPMPTPLKPGFPKFIAGKFPQKAPLPPWPCMFDPYT
jgi:hypothetical protein